MFKKIHTLARIWSVSGNLVTETNLFYSIFLFVKSYQNSVKIATMILSWHFSLKQGFSIKKKIYNETSSWENMEKAMKKQSGHWTNLKVADAKNIILENDSTSSTLKWLTLEKDNGEKYEDFQLTDQMIKKKKKTYQISKCFQHQKYTEFISTNVYIKWTILFFRIVIFSLNPNQPCLSDVTCTSKTYLMLIIKESLLIEDLIILILFSYGS